MASHRSFCRICAAACGIVVTTDGERVVAVAGDRDHPGSRGYLCAKGRGLADWHHGGDRLDRPRLRGEEVGWDRTVADLAAALAGIADDHGSDAVALYLATGLAYDSAGQVAATSWLGSIGSRSFLSAATVDNAPALVAAELVTGHPMTTPVWHPSAGGLLMLVGTNPVVSHGYGTALPDPIRHLRDHRDAGGTTWVVDPRGTETAAHADGHLRVRPGTDAALLAAVAAALLATAPSVIPGCDPADRAVLARVLAPWTAARAAAACGLAPEPVEALIQAIRDHRGRLAILCGTGTQMSRDGVLVEWLRWVVLALAESLDRPGGMRFHDGVFGPGPAPRPDRRPPRPGPTSRPELPRVAGQLPVVALADEIEAGAIRALVVAGGNPLTAAPDPDRMARALRSLEVLAVLDVAENDVTALATHVLPATGQLERADVTLLSHLMVRSAVQVTTAVVSPVAERRPAWWVFARLGAGMGVDQMAGVDPDTIDDRTYLAGMLTASPLGGDAVLQAGPHGLDVPVRTGWMLDRLPDRCWRIAPEPLVARMAAWEPPASTDLVVVPRRDGTWNNSVRYGRTGDPAVIHVHPDDAATRGVVDGDEVELGSAHGAIRAAVALDPTLPAGVVSVGHGRLDRSPGRLTSPVDDVDPLTTMPMTSGVPVRMRRVAPSPGSG